METEHNWNILTRSYGRQRCVFLVLHGCSTGAPSAGCGFPYHISSPTGTRTQLSSTVQFVGLILPSNSHAVIWTRLHASAISFRYLATGMCHFRYLWNGLCDRHRAEIIVMQFRGPSLPVSPVYESIMGFFFLVPLHQPISARRDFLS